MNVAWQNGFDDAPVAVDSTAGKLAVAGAGGLCQILSLETGETTHTFTMPDGLLDIAFHPDGSRLALTGPSGHGVWRLSDGQAVLHKTGRWSTRAIWSDDRLAVADGRTAAVYSAAGDELWRTAPAPSTVTDLAWLRDGRRLTVASYNAIRCHERHQPEPVAEYPYTGSHLAVAVTPNGRWICSGNQDASIHIWRARDGNELTMSGYPEKVTRLVFDPTGRWLAADGAPEVTVWDFAGKGPAGSTARMLRAHETVTGLSWRPGAGGLLASCGREGTVAVWRPGRGLPGKVQRPLATHTLDSAATSVRWAAPGTLIATAKDGTVIRMDGLA